MKFYKTLKCLLAFLFAFSTLQLFAQSRAVTGKIIDQVTGKPLQDVNVNVKGTTQTTTTISKGSFSITVPSASSVLSLSYIGYGTQEITVSNHSSFSILMSSQAANLNEVVVIGYGTVKKRDLTGSVVSIKGEEATKVPATTPIEAIQGKLQGLTLPVLTNMQESKRDYFLK